MAPHPVDRHLGLLFLLPLVLGLTVPSVGKWIAPFSLPLLFAIMVFGLLDVPVRLGLQSALNRDGVALLAVQFGVFSILAFLVAGVFPPELFIGFIMVGAGASGVSVPAVVDLLKGNVPKAVSLTVLDNLAAPVLTPLLVLLLANQRVSVDVVGLFGQMALLIGLPLVLVVVLRKAGMVQHLAPYKKSINLVLLTVLVWGVTAKSADYVYANPLLVASIFVALLAVSVAVMAIGYWLGKDPSERATYGTFAYYKNNTLTITLTQALFGPIPAVVGVVHILAIRVLLAASSWKSNSGVFTTRRK